ncbi:MAG: hypothetical protein QXD32_03940 [Nitrososphaerota archaeon]
MAFRDLMSLADRVRGFGGKVHHIGKAYDDDLYFTVEGNHEGWEKALGFLRGLGFVKVVKYDFSSFKDLRSYEEVVCRFHIPVSLSQLNTLDKMV